MTLQKLWRKAHELMQAPGAHADLPVEAFVIMPDEPKKVIKLGLKQILQDESGTYFQLEFKGIEHGTHRTDNQTKSSSKR